MQDYLILLWHIWLAGFGVMLALLFVTPYWVMPRDEWERLYERQHQKHPEIRGTEETVLMCVSHVIVAAMWPYTFPLIVRDKWRNR